MLNLLILGICSYLVGSINPAYLLGKAKGFDIREKGSGNAGASNAKVTMGWGAGIFVAVFDICKAAAATAVCKFILKEAISWQVVAGVCAIIGHMFPFYLNFKGGKGYASITGVILVINWKLGLIMIGYGIVCTLVTNFIALATVTSAIAYPIIFYFLYKDMIAVVVLALLAAIMTYKHLINIKRILNGTEIGLFKRNKK